MSRQVDIMAGPLSQQDRDYLESRGRRHLILQNERQFPEGENASPAPQGSTDAEDDDDAAWEDMVKQMSVEELRAELSERNMSTAGNKDALAKRLIQAGPED